MLKASCQWWQSQRTSNSWESIRDYNIQQLPASHRLNITWTSVDFCCGKIWKYVGKSGVLGYTTGVRDPQKNCLFIMDTSIRMDDFGVPPPPHFRNPPKHKVLPNQNLQMMMSKGNTRPKLATISHQTLRIHLESRTFFGVPDLT